MALHAAAREGNLDELQRLIGTIKDLNARDKHHRTALVMASWAGQAGSFTYTTCVARCFHMIGMNAQDQVPGWGTDMRLGAPTNGMLSA